MIEESYQKARAVREKHGPDLMRKPNVIGIGIGFRQQAGKRTDEVAVVVMVKRKLSSDNLNPDEQIPSEIDGVPVDVQVVGDIRAQS